MTSLPVAALIWRFGAVRCCLLFVLITATILGMTGCKTAPDEKMMPVVSRTHEADPAPTAEDWKTAKRTTSDQIYTIYSQNLIPGATADQIYRDQLVLVTGVFNGVNRNLPGHAYLELRTHDDSGFTYAALRPEPASLLSTLVPGATVELLCWGDGAVAGNPLLRSCRER